MTSSSSGQVALREAASRQNNANRRYRAAVRAELAQLRAQRGADWMPDAVRRCTAGDDMNRAAALREIDEAWFGEGA